VVLNARTVPETAAGNMARAACGLFATGCCRNRRIFASSRNRGWNAPDAVAIFLRSDDGTGLAAAVPRNRLL
jgi:hypothetical protein